MNREKGPSWEVYERLIARMFADQIQTDLCVTPNAYIFGEITGTKRQIDVLIDDRHNTDNSRRIIVDAKKRARPLDVTDVEAFLGLMDDVRATHGYLVSSSGHSKAAEKRAQEAASLRIVPLDRMENFDPSSWPRCLKNGCAKGRIFWDGYPEIYLVARSTVTPADRRVVRFIHYVGKCDRCGRFHVLCTTCGDLMSVSEDDEQDVGHQCRCNGPWFWLASIEEDHEGRKSAELHSIHGDKVVTETRRSL